MGAYIRFRTNEEAVLAISAMKGFLRRSPCPEPHSGVYVARSTPPSARSRARQPGVAFLAIQSFDAALLVESSGAVLNVDHHVKVAQITPQGTITLGPTWRSICKPSADGEASVRSASNSA